MRVDDTREPNSSYNFVIFCEDSEIEPAYFTILQSDNVKINFGSKFRSKQAQLLYALTECEARGLLDKSVSPARLLFDQGTFVWSVFDMDCQELSPDPTYHEFETAIDTLQQRGFNVAWSNDSFEIWILLHFIDVDGIENTLKHRDDIYDMLTDFLKQFPDYNEFSQRVVKGRDNFHYRSHMKKGKSFKSLVLPLMKGKTAIAIERAEKLEQFHEHITSPSDKSPCTMVHHLVKKILSCQESNN